MFPQTIKTADGGAILSAVFSFILDAPSIDSSQVDGMELIQPVFEVKEAPDSLPGSSALAAVRLLQKYSANHKPFNFSHWIPAEDCDAATIHIEQELATLYAADQPQPMNQATDTSCSSGCYNGLPDNRNISDEYAVRQLAEAVKCILVVDDSPVCLKSMVRIMEKGGYKCLTATDGQQAVAMLDCSPQIFSACIMDLRMPIMDGLTAVQRCKEKGVTIPFIVLSADGGDVEVQRKAIEVGATACLGKPSSSKALLEILSLSLHTG